MRRNSSSQSISSTISTNKIKKAPKNPSLKSESKKKEEPEAKSKVAAAPPLIASAKLITATTSGTDTSTTTIDEQKKELENQKRLLDIQRHELFQACSQTEIPHFYIKEENMHYEAPPTEFWTSSNDEFNILPNAADL